MNRLPPPHMMGNMYRGPRPFNNRWRPRGPCPPPGFQSRPNMFYRPPGLNQTKERSEEHWCETCDRGFSTADQLDKHKQQHQKCNIDGCQFVAHPKVITKHIQMQHSSGLYKKIAKLDNPEEINKWREERKKKYPTRTNIEKKEAECKEKIERGEKMGLKRDRKENNRSSTDHAAGNKRRRSFDKRDQNNRPKTNFNQNSTPKNNNQPPAKKIPRVIPKIPCVVQKNKLKPFAGILSIDMDEEDTKTEEISTDSNNIMIEDDYYEGAAPLQSPIPKPAQEPVVCGALTSLMCEYGSSDEEVEEKENKPHEKPADPIVAKASNVEKNIANVDKNGINDITVKDGVNVKESQAVDKDNLIKVQRGTEVETKLNVNDENSDDEAPVEVKTVKSNVEEPSSTQQDTAKITKSVPSKQNAFRNNQRPINKYRNKIPSTLLHKLLHKEIRHERNIVLQCIRYIKKMNYFEKTP